MNSYHFLPPNTVSAHDLRSPEVIAREHLQRVATEIGLNEADLSSVYVAKSYTTALNGVQHLLFRQRYAGFDVAGAAWTVNVDADGNILNAGGRLYAAPEEAAMASSSSASMAVRAAVAAVNPKVAEKFEAIPNGTPLRSTKGFRFLRGALAEDPEGSQVWAPVSGKLRAGWRFEVTDVDGIGRYMVTVEDAGRSMISKAPLTFYQKATTGMVFEQGTPQPYNYGVHITAPPPYVDRTLQPFTGDPVASPLGWVTGSTTAGNNVVAGENLAGTQFLTAPTVATATNGVFNFPLQLGPGSPNPLSFPDAATTNLFYWMNRAHDLHYQSGFDEAAGNYQADNFGRGGLGGDPVYVYSHFGAQTVGAGQLDNAYFSIRNAGDDGEYPMIAMFLSGPTGATDVQNVFTDGSYDAYVMVHEYTHGVSHRLVTSNYSTFQGGAMGEAWSDFFGFEYTMPPNSPPDGYYPSGEYFFQSWGVGDVRTRPYSTDTTVNALTFADMGKVRYYPEVHSDGEIWMEALLEIRSNLIKQFGEQEGRRRVRLLVIDGMKLSIPAPTMVDARDAILLADRVDFKGASQSQLWAGFAKRGLGALAYSDGGDTVHVVPSYDLPSSAGVLRFYDDPVVIGEPVRVVAQDANNPNPTMLVQLTSSAGDLENLILRRHGSVYFGTLPTTSGNVAVQSGSLSLMPGDQVSAYYVDLDTAPGQQLITSTINTMPAYSAFLVVGPKTLSFPNETQLSRVSLGVYVSEGSALPLPFEFPFYAKKYGAVTVQPNGLLNFESTLGLQSSCTDPTQLAGVVGVAPLWMNLILNGSAQQNEGIFYSSTEKSFTVRWAAETYTISAPPQPVNFAVTLYDDGRILYQYTSPFLGLGDSYVNPGCGAAPIIGISNGHDVYTHYFPPYIVQIGTETYGLRFDPPYNFSSIPGVTLSAPTEGQSVQGILQINGTVVDTAASISRADIIIDGIQRARATVLGATLAASLNINGLGLKPGAHTLRVHLTNTRGAFSDYPAAKPLNFTVAAGQSRIPVIALERPVEGDTVSGTLTVSGYALAETLSISRMDLLVDGFVYGALSYGGRRADACTALQSVSPNCPSVGFTGLFATNSSNPPLPDGTHQLQVRAVDSTGRITVSPTTPVNISVNNGAPSPIAASVTAPKPNDHVSGTITVSGWAYSAGRKITSASLIVDGSTLAIAQYGLAAPDVCSTLTGVSACPNIGFRVTLDTNRLLNGEHRVGILLRNDHGDSTLVPALSGSGMTLFVEN